MNIAKKKKTVRFKKELVKNMQWQSSCFEEICLSKLAIFAIKLFKIFSYSFSIYEMCLFFHFSY